MLNTSQVTEAEAYNAEAVRRLVEQTRAVYAAEVAHLAELLQEMAW